MKLSEAQFVMLDTETTHQDPPKVVELAGVRWVFGRPIENSHFKETYIHPKCKIHPAAMAVHHIQNKDVEGAPYLEEVQDEWAEWIGGDIIVAYNSDYDRDVLIDTPLYKKSWLDAYRMAMHFWSLGQENEDGFGLTSFKQQEMRYWLDLPQTFGEAHRAAADIQVTAHLTGRVIQRYLECGNPDDLKSFVQYIEDPICHDVLPIGGSPFAGKRPEDVEDWAIKKAFDPLNALFPAFKKFNIHECLLPEYIKRFGVSPTSLNEKSKPKDKEQKKGSFDPNAAIKKPSSNTAVGPARWKRK